jgi:hypothetical protein
VLVMPVCVCTVVPHFKVISLRLWYCYNPISSTYIVGFPSYKLSAECLIVFLMLRCKSLVAFGKKIVWLLFNNLVTPD